MTQLEKIEAMKAYLLDGDGIVTDDDLIDLWDIYALNDHSITMIYHMEEFNAFAKEWGFTPLKLVSFVTSDFRVTDDWFIFDSHKCILESYTYIGDVVDSVIDIDKLAKYIVTHPNIPWTTDIACKLIELDDNQA